MWDYNRDGVIDRQDSEDEYWDNEYYYEQLREEEEERNSAFDTEEYDPYEMDEDEMREVLEEEGYDSDKLDEMDEDELIDAIEDINLGITPDNHSYSGRKAEPPGSRPYSVPVNASRPSTQPLKPTQSQGSSYKFGSKKKASFWGILFGGLVSLIVFCMIFDVDISDWSIFAIVILIGVFCSLWYASPTAVGYSLVKLISGLTP